jgi:hypothetical protein
MSDVHRLVGLETDNLLGFLALLGLLRAVDRSRPVWSARAHFEGMPLNARLSISATVSDDEIAQAAAEGCAAYAGAYTFGGHKDLNFDRVVAHELLEDALAEPDRSELLAALCSDAAVRDDGRIEPTPFCALFGQGHQSFLERLEKITSGELPRALREKRGIDLNSAAYIKKALFARWEREDATDSFRWDFEEDRRYALRETEPSGDATTTEHGANRLASLGLISLRSTPTIQRGRVSLATRCASRGGPRRGVRLTWPIWGVPLSLAAIHALLDDPRLAEERPSFVGWEAYGIYQARRVHRIMTGKFVNFTRAEGLRESGDVPQETNRKRLALPAPKRTRG